MRTTIDIADDVLQAAKELARREKKTAGQVLSELARRALRQPLPSQDDDSRSDRPPDQFLGFQPFPSRGGLVTDEQVNRLREDDAC